MSKVAQPSHVSLRTVALTLAAGGVMAVASLIWLRHSPDASAALPTGLVVPITIDPQQMMRERKDLPAQRLNDFSVIFPESH